MAETTATTEAAHGSAGDHGPELLGLSAEGWVYVSVTLFFLVAIFVFKAHRRIADALDAQIAETRKTLDEAQAIRNEAEALLAEAKQNRAASDKEAKAILAQAEKDAADLVVAADEDAKQLIARRAKSAEEKIAAAERAAIADVRAKAASGAAAAASVLIAQHHDAKSDAGLVDASIASLN